MKIFEKDSLAFTIVQEKDEDPPVMYEVKVLDVQKVGSKSWKYFVHYQGWRKSHDQWVTDLIEINEESKEKQREMAVTAQEIIKKRKAKRKADKTLGASSSSSGGAKRSRTDSSEKGEIPQIMNSSLKLHFSGPLKKALMEDFENVTHKKMLVKLHRKPSIETIFDDFLESSKQPFGLCSDLGTLTVKTVQEILEGLKILFDRSLGSSLLYQFERLQFDAIREKHPEMETDLLVVKDNHKRLHQIYGPEHLLRLLIRLPDLISLDELLKMETNVLEVVLNAMLKFISNRKDKYLSSPYVRASNDYLLVLQDFTPNTNSAIVAAQ